MNIWRTTIFCITTKKSLSSSYVSILSQTKPIKSCTTESKRFKANSAFSRLKRCWQLHSTSFSSISNTAIGSFQWELTRTSLRLAALSMTKWSAFAMSLPTDGPRHCPSRRWTIFYRRICTKPQSSSQACLIWVSSFLWSQVRWV